MRTSGSSVETRDIRFGLLSGTIVVAPKCSLLADLEESLSSLANLDLGGSEDSVVNFVVGLSDDEKRLAAGKLRSAIAAVAASENRLSEFSAFFASTNLERISRWGSHPETPMGMSASLSDFGGSRQEKLFELRGSEGRRFAVIIEPVLWWNAGSSEKSEKGFLSRAA